MAAKLILLSGNQQKVYELDERLTTIGRSPASTIMIDDSACSRKHCMIKREHDMYTIIDLQSANGVTVNGEKVKEQTLRGDDKIKIGSASFIFKESD